MHYTSASRVDDNDAPIVSNPSTAWVGANYREGTTPSHTKRCNGKRQVHILSGERLYGGRMDRGYVGFERLFRLR